MRKNVPKITLSEGKVTGLDMRTAVPEGFRAASLDEVTLEYMNSRKFRKNLQYGGWAWTSQKELGSGGLREILESGTVIEAKDERFYRELTAKNRAMHFPGRGFVVVGTFDADCCWLEATANTRSEFTARVALVRDGNYDYKRFIEKINEGKESSATLRAARRNANRAAKDALLFDYEMPGAAACSAAEKLFETSYDTKGNGFRILHPMASARLLKLYEKHAEHLRNGGGRVISDAMVHALGEMARIMEGKADALRIFKGKVQRK